MCESVDEFYRHNSYNRDRGTSLLDYYEGDFIDDSLSLGESKRKKKTERSGSCSSGGVKRKLVLVGVCMHMYTCILCVYMYVQMCVNVTCCVLATSIKF